MDKTPLIEALKEGARVVFLALISYLLTEGVAALILDAIVGTKIDPMMKAQITGLLVIGLRALDKYLHEIGKDSGNDKLAGGLTRF